jgi:hypothetical protein
MHEDIKWLFIVIGGLAVAWFVGGGFNHSSANDPFIKPITDTENVQTYGGSGAQTQPQQTYTYTVQTVPAVNPTLQYQYQSQLQAPYQVTTQIQQQIQQTMQSSNGSPLQGKVSIGNISSLGTDAKTEYIIIQTNPANTEKINITGMKLQSGVTGNGAVIGKGVFLPFAGASNTEEDILLGPGEVVYVVSGRSPLGISFKVNSCSGFYQQFQSFVPNLRTDCPLPRTEIISSEYNFNDECIDYINNLPGCQVFLDPPPTLQQICRSYVFNTFTQNKCIENHRHDPYFFKPEWRVYLNRDAKMWKDRRELVKFIDQNDKVIQLYTY